MEDSDSEQERNDGIGPSRKTQKRMQRKVHETTSKVIAGMTLAEASKRGGSPQVSQTPNRRSDSQVSSPCQSAVRMIMALSSHQPSPSHCSGKRPASRSPSPSLSPSPARSPPSSLNFDVRSGVAHPWIQFDLITEAEAALRLDVLMARPFDASRTISYSTLEALGQTERVSHMITRVWHRFFRIRQPQYKELALEFFSTFEFAHPCSDLTDRHAIRFRLGGQWRHCSVARFGKKMGLYKLRELQTDLFLDGLTDFPSKDATLSFGSKLVLGGMIPTAPKAPSCGIPYTGTSTERSPTRSLGGR